MPEVAVAAETLLRAVLALANLDSIAEVVSSIFKSATPCSSRRVLPTSMLLMSPSDRRPDSKSGRRQSSLTESLRMRGIKSAERDLSRILTLSITLI